MIGNKFNKLTVLEIYKEPYKVTKALFSCECGNTHVTKLTDVKRGRVKSCGCIRGEVSPLRVRNLPEYRVWIDMKTRCLNPNSKAYKYYGARGISVDPTWVNSFLKFYEDMGERPKDMTLERLNNDLGYSKENCKWVSWSENLKNRRSWSNNE